jgi:hypothetical protein
MAYLFPAYYVSNYGDDDISYIASPVPHLRYVDFDQKNDHFGFFFSHSFLGL